MGQLTSTIVHAYFTKKEIEAQRSLVTCPGHIAGEQQRVVQLQAV